MRLRRSIGLLALSGWFAVLAFLLGPARWEVGHTYSHLIEGSEGALPVLTELVALPVLGSGCGGDVASWFACALFWGFTWFGGVAVVIAVLRAATPQEVTDAVVFGGSIYLGGMTLLLSLVVVGLWLPFSLL